MIFAIWQKIELSAYFFREHELTQYMQVAD